MSDLLNLTEEQRFRLLVSAVTDYAIYMLDTDGHIATWNPGAQRFKGYTADEIIGQHFSRFFTPEDAVAGLPQHALDTALKEGRFEAEGWRLRKDGTRFWVNAVIDPIFDDDGNHLGFAKITRDFTEKKLAEDELKATQEALAQSQKLQALGELTGGVAHDFNNLMTVIAGASDFLLKHPDLPLEKRQRYLEAIAETTERATSLTNHLLAFGRRQALKPAVLDLNVRLDAFAEMIGRMLGSPVKVQLDLKASHAAGRGRPDAARNGAAQCGTQRPRRDARRGRARRSEPPTASSTISRRSASPSATAARASRSEVLHSRVRALLHHQGGRQGHRAGPVANPRLCRAGRRPGGDRVPRRRGHDSAHLSCPAPASRSIKRSSRSKSASFRRACRSCWSRTMSRSVTSPPSCSRTCTAK